ncbi:fungal-specific transcription factor domain-containing protein, partial [Leptodontidium sp. 2 PMI_412]
DQLTSFSTVFLPMATVSPSVFQAVIAWSSGHLSIFDDSYKLTALKARSRALGAMCEVLSTKASTVPDQEANLATALVLVANEIGLDTGSEWYEHLKGARDIIISAESSGPGGRSLQGSQVFKTSSDGQWLLRNFAYHDVLSSIISGRRLLIEDNYLDDISVETDSYLGAAFPVMKLISKICSLRYPHARDQEIDPFLTSINTFWDNCYYLESILQEWTCKSTTKTSLSALANSYRSAGLICLYRHMRTWAMEDFAGPGYSKQELCMMISNAVDAIMTNLSLIPVTDGAVCGLLFPLFMAGGETTEQKHIETIRSRLSYMLKERGFQNVRRALDTLEQVWQQNCSGSSQHESGMMDWATLLEGSEEMLILT